MPETRLGLARLAMIAGLAALTLGSSLGRAGRLTYHEAFVAQAAREMIASGDLLVPTIAGRPWLEKPPLAIWLVALIGRSVGGVDESVARVPSAIGGGLLAVGVALLAARRFGARVGLLAGLVQATTVWTVLRGRLAEADMLLACLVVWTLLAFDRVREGDEDGERSRGGCGWRWVFFAGLGLMSLAKGIGFGAVLVAAVLAMVLAWDRDRMTLRRLGSPGGWCLAGVLALTWPILAAVRHPTVLGLWSLHVTDRLAARSEHFAGGPWWQYGPALLWQVLPWTPLAVVGAWRSLRRSVGDRGGADRLLWAWAVAPVALLSMATVKHAHYAIHALPPWSIWAALSLERLGERLRARERLATEGHREKGNFEKFQSFRFLWSFSLWPSVASVAHLRMFAAVGFAGLGVVYGLAFGVFSPWLDRRGVEWAFYESAGRSLRPEEPLALLYDDWDRAPYPTPFGPVPHDLGVRLFYLNHPACWRLGTEALAEHPPAPGPTPFAVIGRERDLPALRRIGQIETVARGPTLRARASRVDDRTFLLFRVTPEALATEDTTMRETRK